MRRDSVKSSFIRSVGYDQHKHILEVEFDGTGVYQYLDVPAEAYTMLMLAPSKGSFFDYHIKEHYEYKKI